LPTLIDSSSSVTERYEKNAKITAIERNKIMINASHGRTDEMNTEATPPIIMRKSAIILYEGLTAADAKVAIF
jgi:hypothetical protein